METASVHCACPYRRGQAACLPERPVVCSAIRPAGLMPHRSLQFPASGKIIENRSPRLPRRVRRPRKPMKHRTLALAGLMQGLNLAQSTARTGSAPEADLAASLASIFRIDADSVEAVYGSARLMRNGLETLIGQFEGGERRDPSIGKMALTVLHIERQLSARADLMQALHDGILDSGRQREHFGVTHATVIARLGDLYANSVSRLSTRVLVQGNPYQLQQPQVVAQIRACLLASVRSAVLWRQLCGSYWDLMLRRRAMLDAAQHWLESA